MRPLRTALPALLTVLALAAGCSAVPVPDFTDPAPVGGPTSALVGNIPATTIPAGRATEALAQLPVKGRAPKTGYARTQFLPHGWADVDGDGCDTREAILARDAVASTNRKNSGCIDTVSIDDPYSGTRIDGRAAIDIDHVVALGDAWQTGAQYPGDPEGQANRASLANDPLNLLAVSDRLNRQKSDSDAASWLPPNKAFRCAYVARQIAVKIRYMLWVTPAEHDAMAGILAGCPDQTLPEG